MRGINPDAAGMYTIVMPQLESVSIMPVVPLDEVADVYLTTLEGIDQTKITSNPTARLAHAQCAVIEASRGYVRSRRKKDAARWERHMLEAVRYLATVSGSDFGVLVDHASDAPEGVLSTVDVDTHHEFEDWLDENLDKTVGRAMVRATREGMN